MFCIYTFLAAEYVAAVHLGLVQGHRSDFGARKAVNVPRRPPNAAAAVQDVLPRLHAQFARQVVLMTQDGLPEGLVGLPGGEVKRRAPAPLVEVSSQVVVRIHQSSVVLLAARRASGFVGVHVVVFLDACLLAPRERRKENHRLLQALEKRRRNCCTACYHRQVLRRELHRLDFV